VHGPWRRLPAGASLRRDDPDSQRVIQRSLSTKSTKSTRKMPPVNFSWRRELAVWSWSAEFI